MSEFEANFQDREGPAARNRAGSMREIQAYLAAGIGGFFTDEPAIDGLR